jgi:hypothetical protein
MIKKIRRTWSVGGPIAELAAGPAKALASAPRAASRNRLMTKTWRRSCASSALWSPRMVAHCSAPAHESEFIAYECAEGTWWTRLARAMPARPGLHPHRPAPTPYAASCGALALAAGRAAVPRADPARPPSAPGPRSSLLRRRPGESRASDFGQDSRAHAPWRRADAGCSTRTRSHFRRRQRSLRFIPGRRPRRAIPTT